MFQAAGVPDLSGYQTYDKALDVYYLTIAYAATIRNWDGGPAFVIGRALWYYRLIGVVLFENLGHRWLLVVFPNTFEYFFIAVELMKTAWNPFELSRGRLIALAAAIWLFIKLPQEWWLHVAQLDATDVLRDVVLTRPILSVLLVAALTIVIVLLWRRRDQLPPPDWPVTLDADVQSEHLGWPDPPDEVQPAAFFGWQFAEKALLVTLVILIFEEILPGATRGIVQVGVATSAIIAVSTLLSQWLARRGLTWRSALAEMVVMSLANAGIAVASARFLPGSAPRPPLATFVFLIVLLTLIVVLFDRFKSIDRRRPVFGGS